MSDTARYVVPQCAEALVNRRHLVRHAPDIKLATHIRVLPLAVIAIIVALTKTDTK
jgi:hypothetical protein